MYQDTDSTGYIAHPHIRNLVPPRKDTKMLPSEYCILHAAIVYVASAELGGCLSALWRGADCCQAVIELCAVKSPLEFGHWVLQC